LKFQNFVAKESGEIIGEAIFSHGAIERGDQHRADVAPWQLRYQANSATVRRSTLFALPLIRRQETTAASS
jgi:hypothetical protein